MKRAFEALGGGLAAFFDRWREILDVMRRRKLRTALTALSVAWGIFMLVVLLAAGEGLANGAETQFSRDAMNSVFVFPFALSKPHKGNPAGKRVPLFVEDEELAREKIDIAELSSPLRSLNGVVRHGTRNGNFNLIGVRSDYGAIEKSDIVAGRYLSPDDERERRKVAVLGVKVKRQLFGPDEEAVGAQIEIQRIPFIVIGVFDEPEEDDELQNIYVPLSTHRMVLAWPGEVGNTQPGKRRWIERFVFTVGEASGAETGDAIENLRAMLAERKGFAPDDKMAIRFINAQEIYERFRRLFTGIRTFVWLIGLGTILAGVVGVSNIMLISVQERTREIGVRKAVGAPPSAIVSMIVQEALAITLVSGYLGLVAGVALVTFAQKVVPPGPFFKRPDIDFGTAITATVVLAIAGTLAGLFPALRAARVQPIAALRVE